MRGSIDFKSNGTGILSFFLLFFGLSLVELLIHTYSALSRTPTYVRENFLSSIETHRADYLIFLFQVLLVLGLLAVFAEIIFSLLRLKSRVQCGVVIFAVSIFKNFAELPHLFISQTNAVLLKGISLGFWILVFTFPFLIYFWFSTKAVSAQRLLLAIGASVLLVFGGEALDRAQLASLLLKDTNPKESSVIMISIDSLRPDFVKDYLRRHPKSRFAEVFAQGTRFENMITPMSRTHPALTSLLSGQDPPDHGLRENLQAGAHLSDRSIGVGVLPVFRENGFNRVLMIDEVKFASFTEGEALSRVVSPRPHVTDHTIPQVFRSSLFWAFFNNVVGRSVVRSLDFNAAFTVGYRPRQFLKKVVSEIQAQSEEKFFLLAHTCSLHYPGHSRMPYITRFQNPFGKIETEYRGFFQAPDAPPSQEMLESFYLLSKGQFDQVMEEMIEPLIQYLDDHDLLKRVHLVLMSDHGESFWLSDPKYNVSPVPTHGSPAIFNEDSYRSFFLSHSPDQVPETVTHLTSLTDVSVALKGLAKRESKQISANHFLIGPKYHESGVWIRGQVQSRLSFHDRHVERVYEVQSDGRVQIRSQDFDSLIVEKSRSVFFDKHHWTFLPTRFGLEAMICQYPNCRVMVEEDRGEYTQIVAPFLALKSKKDREQGLFYSLSQAPSRRLQITLGSNSSRQLKPPAEWLFWMHRLNTEGDSQSALKWLIKSLKNERLDTSLRALSFDVLVETCVWPNPHQVCQELLDWEVKWMQSEAFRSWLENFPFLKNLFRRRLGIPIGMADRKRLAALISKDEGKGSKIFFQVLESFNAALSKQDRDQIRSLLNTHRERMKTWSFYWQLWSVVDIDQLMHDPNALILEVAENFKHQLGIQIFEFDRDWIFFLQRLSQLTGQNIHQEWSMKFLKEGRLPYSATVNYILPAAIGANFDCYQSQILPKIMDHKVKPISQTSEVWSEQLLKVALKLKSMCDPKPNANTGQ